MIVIDSRDYEAGEPLTHHHDIVQWMLDGGLVKSLGGALVYGHDERGFYSLGSPGSSEQSTGNFPGNVTWRKAILIRKPISWEDAVRSMLDGKHVWDKDGVEWRIIGGMISLVDTGAWPLHAREAPFYLTPPPAVVNVSTATNGVVFETKPRRKVSREDAICAMVRDPEQRCWSTTGYVYKYRFDKTMVCMSANGISYSPCEMTGECFYLDPPEAK
jgi:hypothetical protein